MKTFIYILKDQKAKYYVGSTSDLKRRLSQHKSGNVLTTKRMEKPALVFYQQFKTLTIARRIERKIKSWERKDFIEKIIKEGYIKITGV